MGIWPNYEAELHLSPMFDAFFLDLSLPRFLFHIRLAFSSNVSDEVKWDGSSKLVEDIQ